MSTEEVEGRIRAVSVATDLDERGDYSRTWRAFLAHGCKRGRRNRVIEETTIVLVDGE